MATFLKNLPENITEYPNSFKRQGAFPLECYSVFSSLEAAKDYAENSKIAYVTQPLGVASMIDGKIVADYYIIGDEFGTLIHIGNSNHNLDEINDRLKQIEKFFATEDGESIKETLDQLIELQKWIEGHLEDFEETTERLDKRIDDLTVDNIANTDIVVLGREGSDVSTLDKILEQEISARNDQVADLNLELKREIERATLSEEGLNKALEQEAERANKADEDIYKTIAALDYDYAETEAFSKEDSDKFYFVTDVLQADGKITQTRQFLTEETVYLNNNLYTYVNIGKITGASDTSRKLVGEKGASLKEVFNKILGTRTDKLPTISNNASLTAGEGTKNYGGGEYGTAVAATDVIITFTLANTGTTNYGYKTAEGSYSGQQTFYYPIVKQENADIKIVLPLGKNAIVTTGDLVKQSDNILYCNFINKQVSIKISLEADTVDTSEQTRYNTISAEVQLGVPTDAQGQVLTGFLTYLEMEGETPQVTPPSPSEKIGGNKSDTAGPYKISKGEKYVYWATTSDTNPPTTWKRYSSGQTKVEDLQLSCNAGEYLWVATTGTYTSFYAWNDASGKYNTDKLSTIKIGPHSITNYQNVVASGYYFYRTTDSMNLAINTKFKLA